MLVFLNGSINSGKTSTAKALAKKIVAEFVDVDTLSATIPNFDFHSAADLEKSMDLAIQTINSYTAEGKDVVANYVVRQEDYERFEDEIDTKEQYFITLSPRLEVAQSKRGSRELKNWEVERIKYHYDTGIATPKFGYIIDNSDIGLDETVDKILEYIGRKDSRPPR